MAQTLAVTPLAAALEVLDQAVGILHQVVEAGAGGADASPYIDASLRPDLYGAPGYTDGTDLEKRLAEGDPSAKRELDSPQG